MLRRWLGSEARVIEWVNAIGNTLWGLWLFNPHIDFNRPAYEIFVSLAPQHAWGVIIAGLGIAQAIALSMESRGYRQWFALAQAFVWLFIAGSLGVSNFNTTALPTYLWIAALHVVIWFRLAVLHR